MAYDRNFRWEDGVTPLSAENLNKMMDGINMVLDALYPVGAIFQSTGSTPPPIGTWTKIAEGRTLVGTDSSHAAGSTGGAATHTHTNPTTGSTAITINQMPSHNHTQDAHTHNYTNGKVLVAANTDAIRNDTGDKIDGSANKYPFIGSASSFSGVIPTFSQARPSIGATGGGQGHTHSMGNTGSASNLPLCYYVNIWRRTE